MRRTILSLMAATCLTVAAPAAALAQDGMNINERQAKLDARIDAGVRNRSLTAQEAAQLRTEFQGIAQLEQRYRASGGGLSQAERADLDRRFDLLSRRIAYDRHDDQDRAGGDMNINERQRQLDARIDAGVRSGALTAREAQDLRAEFQVIARQEAGYRASGRGLTAAERADLDRRFDSLEARVRAERSDGQVRGQADNSNINQRQREIDARIDAGVRSGALTAREAQGLRAEFQAIARQEASYRASGRGLTAAERADLDRRFDSLEARVRAERSDRQVRGQADNTNINQRQRQIDMRIDAGVRSGQLTRSEAQSLRAEFQAIARQEASYRASGRGLTAAERMELDRRFDRLERRVNNNRTDDDRRWTNLDRRQAAFEQRLDRAVQERRVTPQEAYSLKLQFRTIARLERSYRMSRPGITARERADLNARFDRMEDDFRRSVSPTDNLFDLLIGLVNS